MKLCVIEISGNYLRSRNLHHCASISLTYNDYVEKSENRASMLEKPTQCKMELLSTGYIESVAFLKTN